MIGLGFAIANGGTTDNDILWECEYNDSPSTLENTQEESLVNGNTFVVLATVVDPPFDPATQTRTGPVDTWDGTTAARTYTVLDMTAQALIDKQQTEDIAILREAGKDLALVLTELVQWTLDNTSMLPTDFTASVKDAYLDLSAIADRVKT